MMDNRTVLGRRGDKETIRPKEMGKTETWFMKEQRSRSTELDD